MGSITDKFILFSWKKLVKGQLIQPSRGRLLQVVERVFPFVYIAKKRSWRAA